MCSVYTKSNATKQIKRRRTIQLTTIHKPLERDESLIQKSHTSHKLPEEFIDGYNTFIWQLSPELIKFTVAITLPYISNDWMTISCLIGCLSGLTVIHLIFSNLFVYNSSTLTFDTAFPQKVHQIKQLSSRIVHIRVIMKDHNLVTQFVRLYCNQCLNPGLRYRFNLLQVRFLNYSETKTPLSSSKNVFDV